MKRMIFVFVMLFSLNYAVAKYLANPCCPGLNLSCETAKYGFLSCAPPDCLHRAGNESFCCLLANDDPYRDAVLQSEAAKQALAQAGVQYLNVSFKNFMNCSVLMSLDFSVTTDRAIYATGQGSGLIFEVDHGTSSVYRPKEPFPPGWSFAASIHDVLAAIRSAESSDRIRLFLDQSPSIRDEKRLWQGFLTFPLEVHYVDRKSFLELTYRFDAMQQVGQLADYRAYPDNLPNYPELQVGLQVPQVQEMIAQRDFSGVSAHHREDCWVLVFTGKSYVDRMNLRTVTVIVGPQMPEGRVFTNYTEYRAFTEKFFDQGNKTIKPAQNATEAVQEFSNINNAPVEVKHRPLAAYFSILVVGAFIAVFIAIFIIRRRK